jgi:hypothetical protein
MRRFGKMFVALVVGATSALGVPGPALADWVNCYSHVSSVDVKWDSAYFFAQGYLNNPRVSFTKHCGDDGTTCSVCVYFRLYKLNADGVTWTEYGGAPFHPYRDQGVSTSLCIDIPEQTAVWYEPPNSSNGTVTIWDRGTYKLEVMFVAAGPDGCEDEDTVSWAGIDSDEFTF